MKKLIVLISLILMTLTVHAQEPQNYVIIDQPTNIRSAPLVGLYPRKYIVRAVVSQITLPAIGRNFGETPVCSGILQQDNRLWIQVTVNGVEGWVKFCANDFVGDLTLLPQTEPLNPETRLCASSFRRLDVLGETPSTAYLRATTKAYRINLRSRPDITSERIDLLTSEEVFVTRRSPDNIWVKVSYDAMVATCGWRAFYEMEPFEGWVAAFLLDLPDGWQDIIPIVES